jgi:hypothetical protein
MGLDSVKVHCSLQGEGPIYSFGSATRHDQSSTTTLTDENPSYFIGILGPHAHRATSFPPTNKKFTACD